MFAALAFAYNVIGMVVVLGFGFGFGQLLGKNIRGKHTFIEFATPWLAGLGALLLLSLLIYWLRRFEINMLRMLTLDVRMFAKLADQSLTRFRLWTRLTNH